MIHERVKQQEPGLAIITHLYISLPKSHPSPLRFRDTGVVSLYASFPVQSPKRKLRNSIQERRGNYQGRGRDGSEIVVWKMAVYGRAATVGDVRRSCSCQHLPECVPRWGGVVHVTVIHLHHIHTTGPSASATPTHWDTVLHNSQNLPILRILIFNFI